MTEREEYLLEREEIMANARDVSKEYKDILAKKYPNMIFSFNSITKNKALQKSKLSRIKKFLKLAKKEGFNLSISRQDIIDLQNRYGIKRPTWLMKDKSYRLTNGLYRLYPISFYENNISSPLQRFWSDKVLPNHHYGDKARQIQI